MSPAETKKAKRRKNKKVARLPAKDPIEGVGMSTGVGSANPSSRQNEKNADALKIPTALTSACGPKDSLPACIICSKPYGTGCTLEVDENKEAVDFFGPEAVWVCSECRENLPSEEALLSEDIDLSALRDGTLPKELLSMADELEASACLCEPYTGWRASEAELLLEQQELRLCWQGVKQALHQAYQKAGLSLGEALARQVAAFRDERVTPSDAEVRGMVSRLRRRDPHRLLQCLKYQAQLFIVESRLRMLRHVVASTATTTELPRGARLEDSLVAEYSKLRHAWEGLNPLLEELVTLDLNKYGLSWELVNKYLFQAIVYSDPAIHKCLPDLLTQKHSVKFKQDHKALLELDSEMALTTIIWRKVQQLLDEPVQFEQQMLQAQWERLASGWKSLDPEFLAKTAGLLSGDLPIDGVHERRTCCLGTSVTESQCPFAEAGLRVSVLAAAGEPSATPHVAPPYSLHEAVWAHGGDTCSPGADLTPSSQPATLGTQSEGDTTQLGARTSLKKVAEPCECHACASVPWPSPPLLPLPAPSPQQPLIHPHLYGSAPRGINLELESLDTLQQQAYLATLGDWDDSHYKLGPRHVGGLESPQPAPPGTGPPPGPPLRASSPPPVSVRRHSEQGSCLDCDNALLDGEDSMDDSCSEHSSSTTASNQRGESRVCDCCYCEVFGHGAPAVAPVSKNYQEMRDRLRLILSKRKHHAKMSHCPESGPPGQRRRREEKAEAIHMAKQQQQQHDHQGQHEDNRGVEELLSYINGTDSGGKAAAHVAAAAAAAAHSATATKGAVAKRQKRKTKRVETESLHALQREECDKVKELPESKSHSPSPISRLIEEESEETKVTPLPPKAVLNTKEARKENGIRLSKCSKNNSNHSSSSSTDCIASIGELGDKACPPQGALPCPRIASAMSSVSNGRVPTTSISGNVFIIESPSLSLENSKVKDTASKLATEDTQLSVKAVAACPRSVFKKLTHDSQEAEVTVTALPPSNHQRSNGPEQLSAMKKELCIAHQLNGTQATSKSKKSRKKKNSSADVTSPDDVFLPKDIDLENGDLDELEREVEAFKRFCFNSVPVANKEKVHVNLKDILLRRKQSSAAMLSPGLLQRT